MKYLALLRGVNVGGKGMIKMAEIKTALENAGFDNVSTYINSGNIIFESNGTDTKQLGSKIEEILEQSFFKIDCIILAQDKLKEVLRHIPSKWKQEDLRKYIAFIKSPAKPEDVIKEAKLKEDIDFIDKGPMVIYMTTKMSGLTKSSFPKLISKPIYKSITIRNYNTAKTLLAIMEKS